MYRWLATGALTANQYSLHRLIVPSNFVRTLVPLTPIALSEIYLFISVGDAQTQKAITTWTVGSGVNHQQIGNTWSGQTDLVSLSVSGALNIFEPRTGDKPVRVFNVSPSFSCTWYLCCLYRPTTGSPEINNIDHTLLFQYLPSRWRRWPYILLFTFYSRIKRV